jgi:hypothetical protein
MNNEAARIGAFRSSRQRSAAKLAGAVQLMYVDVYVYTEETKLDLPEQSRSGLD